MNASFRTCVAVMVCISLLLMSACVKDKPAAVSQAYAYELGAKVYFVNEGNYGSGNATLGIYNPSSGNLYNDVFGTVNGYGLGDVLQSVMVSDNVIYLAVDNSHQLITADIFSLRETSRLAVANPRYLLKLAEDKIYVSSLYDNKIHVYNPLTNIVSRHINLSSNSPENMLLHHGYVYVAAWDTAKSLIYKIDPNTDEIVQTIDIGYKAPQALVADAHDRLWIFFGNSKYLKPYGAVVYDVFTGSVIKHYDMGTSVEMIKPILNTTKDTIYWLGVDYAATSELNGVYKMSIDADEMPNRPFIPAARFQYFYALGFDHLNQQIYVGDPKSFTEMSDVLIYNVDGTLYKRLQTGMGIGSFYFSY